MAQAYRKPLWAFLLVALLLTSQGVHYACHALHFIEEQGGLSCQEVAGVHTCTSHERLAPAVVDHQHTSGDFVCPLCQGQSYAPPFAMGEPFIPVSLSVYAAGYDEYITKNDIALAVARGPPLLI